MSTVTFTIDVIKECSLAVFTDGPRPPKTDNFIVGTTGANSDRFAIHAANIDDPDCDIQYELQLWTDTNTDGTQDLTD